VQGRRGISAARAARVVRVRHHGNGRGKWPWDDAIASDLNFDVSFDWFVTEKVTVRGGAYNGVQMSSIYSGNAMEYVSAWLGVGWRISPTWMLSARSTYRSDNIPRSGFRRGRDDRSAGRPRRPSRAVRLTPRGGASSVSTRKSCGRRSCPRWRPPPTTVCEFPWAGMSGTGERP
jgi:hypothetical protein